MVNRGLWKTRDYVCNYRGRAAGKRLLRCSTLFIKSGGELLGMLCINVDTSSYVSLSEGILRLAGIEPEAFPRPAKGKARGEDLYRDREAMIKAVLEEMGIEGDAAGKLTQENRLPVIERLMEQGVFLLRGSVSSVARKLRCSEASLYRYIGVLNKRKAEELGGRS
jgi:predicted transcriptional regulator YheO